MIFDKSKLKILAILPFFCILLSMQMTDDVLADHKIGDDVIHENLYELKIKTLQEKITQLYKITQHCNKNLK